MICSHPVLFGIKSIQVAPGKSVGPGEEITAQMNFRSILVGQINVRFLIRYEVEGLPDDVPSGCKYRIARLILFLNSNQYFKVTPNVNMSVKDIDKYIVNFQTWQKINAAWYEQPKFTSIEIVRGQGLWDLDKKDDIGHFVTMVRNPDKQ